MTDVLNFYLEKYGLIEKQEEKKQIYLDEKARQRWTTLRKNIRNVSELVSQEDLKHCKLVHGVKFIRRIEHEAKIQQSFYLSNEKDCFVTLDGKSIRFIDDYGRIVDIIHYSSIPVPFSCLTFAVRSNRIIAWTAGKTELFMLNNQFQIIEEVEQNLLRNAPIRDILYNEDRNEIISAQNGSLIGVWELRYANKHLIPRLWIHLKGLDKNSKCIWSLERTESRHQRLYVALKEGLVGIELLCGRIVVNCKQLHDRPITALEFFNPLKLLISGAEDGCIKVWSTKLEEEDIMQLKMVFVGHNAAVNCLNFFPGGSQATIISSGEDKTLRVFNLELNDEVECVNIEYSAKHTCTDITKTTFISTSESTLELWEQHQLYEDLLTLPSPVTSLRSVVIPSIVKPPIDLPKYSIFAHCRQNGLVFLTDSGNPESVLLKTSSYSRDSSLMANKIISCVFDSGFCSLYILIEGNIIQKYDGASDPMVLVDEYLVAEDRSPYVTIIAVLEEDDRRVREMHLSAFGGYSCLNIGVNMTKNQQPTPLLLLISGSIEGGVNVHDSYQPSDLVYTCPKAHDHAVTGILTDTTNNRMFSAATEDCTIIVWQVYPFARDQPLSKLLTLYCGLRPTHMTCIDGFLLSAFEDEAAAQFPIVVYDIEHNNRFDHAPTDDHTEPVTSVSSSTRMKIFLSTTAKSRGTIKIWTRKNVLLRQLEMQLPIYCGIFSTARADILASIGRQICFISHKIFLPKVYMKKQLLMKFSNEKEENEIENFQVSIPETDKALVLKEFNKESLILLDSIKSVFRYQKYIDILSEDEALDLDRKRDVRQKHYDKLAALEKDIEQIKMGNHTINKERLKNYLEKPQFNDIFDHYISQFIKFKPIKLPKSELEEEQLDKQPRKLKKYHPSHKEGFFPTPQDADKTVQNTSINPYGYIPNSTLANILWPPNILKESDATSNIPLLTSLDKLQEELAKKLGVVEEEETKIFDWGSDDESTRIELFDSPTKSKESKEDVSLNKFEIALKESPPKLEKEESFVIEESRTEIVNKSDTPKRPVSTTMTKENIKLPPLSRVPATMPDLKRVRFEPPTEEVSSPKEISVPVIPSKKPEKIPESIRKEKEIIDDIPPPAALAREKSFFMTELDHQATPSPTLVFPKFIMQFIDDDWFHSLCPPPYNDPGCLRFLPDPLSESAFCKFLLQNIQSDQDFFHITGFVEALGKMYSQNMTDKSLLTNIANVLESKINSIPKLNTTEEIKFFKTAMQLMASMQGLSDRGVVTIGLSRYFDGDKQLRAFIKSVFCHCGMTENSVLLEKELDNFKLFTIRDGDERLKDLLAMVTEWLQKWFQASVNFAEKSRKIISKEMALIEMKSDNVSKIAQRTVEDIQQVFNLQILSSYDLMCLYPIEKSSKSVLTFVNSLNYFIFKISTKKKQNVLVDSDKQTDGPKKTIISLPKLDPDKQCLVRLGESNADVLQKEKRDFSMMDAIWMRNVIVDRTQHPSMQPFTHYQTALSGGFVPYLHLPPRPCLVNPFPRPEDLLEWQAVHPQSCLENPFRLFLLKMSLPPEPF